LGLPTRQTQHIISILFHTHSTISYSPLFLLIS
jgi:hypothetical protein